MLRRLAHPSRSTAFLAYIAPGYLIFILFLLYPVLNNLVLSLQEWNGIGARSFVGLANYRDLFGERIFLQSLANNFILVIFMTILPTAIGLVLATLIERKAGRMARLCEFAYFIPQVLSMVVIGVIWRWIYNPSFGILNSLLELLGMAHLKSSWLGDPNLALVSVGMTGTWVAFGFAMVVFLAGYKRIPVSLFESASLDGASETAVFFRISLPLLLKEGMIILIFLFINAFKTFDLIYIMTKGGPGGKTSVLSLLVFKKAFQYNDLGSAAASAMILSMLIVGISLATFGGKLNRE